MRSSSRAFLVACAFLAAASRAEEAQPETAEGEQEEVGEGGKSRKELASQYVYCMEDNCYDLLGVSPEAGPLTIKRAYRRLASEWHPDKNPDPRAKEIFQKYANAYEVLSDSEMKKNYDYLLAHPYEFPMHFLRFGSGRYAPKSDVRTVMLFVVLGISAIQYLFQQQRRTNMLEGVKGKRQYQERLKVLLAEIAESKVAGKPKSGSAKSKKESAKDAAALAEKRKEAEAKLLEEISPDLPPEPSVHDTLAVVIFTAPLTCSYGIYNAVSWFARFQLLRQEYGPAEKAYLTSKALGLKPAELQAMDEAEREALIERELWVSANKEAYEEEVAAAADTGKLGTKEKRAIRQKKKGVEPMPMMD